LPKIAALRCFSSLFSSLSPRLRLRTNRRNEVFDETTWVQPTTTELKSTQPAIDQCRGIADQKDARHIKEISCFVKPTE
jgi:hypothetical protein